MRLTADPNPGLIDEPVTWTVDDVEAGSAVTLRLSGVDAAGRHWFSDHDYPVALDGTLAVEDPDEPWATMRLTDTDVAPVGFTAPATEWQVTAEVAASGRTARTELRRLYQRDVDTESRSGSGWRLRLFRPRGATAAGPGVLVVPGSTGVEAMAPTAALLASHGYPAAVLGYLQEPGLPASLDQVPVEVLAEGLAAFRESDPSRTAVWAASVGTGLALAALAQPDAPPVAAVIAVSPTDVVWQALGADGPPPRRSALTRAGDDLPWLPMQGQALLGQAVGNAVRRRLPGPPRSTALRLFDAYARGRRDGAAVERATIAVERIAAPLLLIAGTADAMWPARDMATRIAERRRDAGCGEHDEMLLLPGAGHFNRPPATPTTVDRNADLVSGGTPAGNAAGQRQGWTTALAFLDRTLH